MERKIGEIFEFEGKIYEVVKDFTFSCRDCDLKKFCSPTKHISQEFQAPLECANTKRSDKENVVFKEIKKDMEIKDNKLTINIPEGMEVDIENSDLKEGVIRFKKKQLTYGDITRSLDGCSALVYATKNFGKLVAIDKLTNIAKYYNGNWKPNQKNLSPKYYIYFGNFSKVYAVESTEVYCGGTVYFKNREDAQAVINNPNFREILDAIFKN